ncbi:unnamed protein product [Owenia fusiformis]|uniref:Uncharacterized protein n=1 Tax=Owenia fusiformis TaxID=6347 RepID=A0A8J1UAM2_OWEFU|nr:unnamed protein product [Owenia fusiformis]
MFSSKQKVDKHVASGLSRIQDPKQRYMKGYSYAKLYFEIKEYDHAKRYLTGYMSINDNMPAAHKLLGQIYDATNEWEKALACYKRSLELDEKQKELLLKICELCCKFSCNPEQARYWADKAENLYPGHATIFKLREALYREEAEEGPDQKELENLITTELTKRPKDVSLRIRLLKLYMDIGRVNEAYSHAVDVEKKMAFKNNLSWYEMLVELFEVYKTQSGQHINGMFHMQQLSALNSLTALTLELKGVTESIQALKSFDQCLLSSTKQKCNDPHWRPFLIEMEAQLFFYAGTVILKRAQKNDINWKDAVAMASVCYLVTGAIGPLNYQDAWYVNASGEDKKLYKSWYDGACDRLCQAGYMVQSMCKGDSKKWLQTVKQNINSKQAQQKLYTSVFSKAELPSLENSFLMQSSRLSNFSADLPNSKKLATYKQVAHKLRPDNLHYLVWFGLQSHQPKDAFQSNYHLKVFEGILEYAADDIHSGAPETLSQLDTEGFLYATIHCTSVQIEERKAIAQPPAEQPYLLPACINDPLCSAKQSDWWTTAHKLSTDNARDGYFKLRQTLQRGLETIRLIGNHGMDVQLVVHLAKTFANCVPENSINLSREELGQRDMAVLYWKNAIETLKKHAKNQQPRIAKDPIFPMTKSAKLPVDKLLNEGKFFLAKIAMSTGRNEEAAKAFAEIPTPYASHNQAKVYMKMAEDVESCPQEDFTDDLKTEWIALLTKAKEALYVTLDRTRGDKNHKLNQILVEDLNEVESKLEDIEAEKTGKNSTWIGDETPQIDSPASHSTPTDSRIRTSLSRSLHNNSQHIRPSPERLDAQMRSISTNQDAMIKAVLDCNKQLMESQQEVVRELKESREIIGTLKAELETYRREDSMRNSLLGGTPVSNYRGRPMVYTPQGPSPQLYQHSPMPQPGPGMHPTPPHGPPLPHGPHPPQPGAHPPPPGAHPPPYGPQPLPHGAHPTPPGPPPPHLPMHHGPNYVPPYPLGPNPPHPQHIGQPPQFQMLQGFEAGATPFGGQQNFLQTPTTSKEKQVDNKEEKHYDEDEDYDYEDYDEHEYVGEDYSGDHQEGSFHIPDSQLVQNWPYGNNVNIEGKSTVTYTPPTGPGQIQGLGHGVPAQGHPGQFQALGFHPGSRPVAQAPMPAPGFFSTPPKQAVSGSSSQSSIPVSINTLAVTGSPLTMAATAVSSTMPPNIVTSNTSGLPSQFPVGAEVGTPFTLAMPQNTPTIPPASVPIATNVPAAASVPLATSVSVAQSVTGAPIKVTSPATSLYPVITPVTPPTTGITPKSPKDLKAGGKMGRDRRISERSSDGEYYHENDSYNEPDFTPIVPLPEKVEVVTGEEDDEPIFQERAKLYRFDSETKQWKERGTGEMKILKRIDGTSVRILMRREQVLKICANHKITQEMALSAMPKNDKSWIWHAVDFSEGESVLEQFCIRFKTPELANEFKAAFEKGKKIMAAMPKSPVKPKEQPLKVVDTVDMSKFKPSKDSWDCETCYINNPGDRTQCPACNTVKPGCEPPAQAKPEGFTFGSGGSGFSFGSGAASTGGAAAPSGGFKFGSSATPVAAVAVTSSSTGGFKFGGSSTPSSATSASSTTTASTSATTSGGFKLGGTSTPSSATSAPSTTTSTSAVPSGGFKFGGATPTTTATSVPATTPKSVGFTFGTTSATNTTTTSNKGAGILKSLLESGDEGDQKVPDESAKSTLGGFTFSEKPKVADEKKPEPVAKPVEVKKTEEAPAAKPFSSFSFGSTKSTDEKSKPLSTFSFKAPEPAKKPDAPSSGVLFGSSGDASSFSSLASETAKTDGFKKTEGFKGFGGEGTQIFGSPSRTRKESEGSEGGDDYEPNADFKPIVPLPALVEVKTGEEEEEVLFSERAKLFRYDTEKKEWKERGLGNMKILKHKDTKKPRILMRREQVLKICANHAISTEMKMEPQNQSDKAWCWHANDFADGEYVAEFLAIKFKTPELAKNFKDVFDECQKRLGEISQDSSKADGSEKAGNADDLGDRFKPKQGDWECPGCYVNHEANADSCNCCGSNKPSEKQASKAEPKTTNGDLAAMFKPEEGSWECTGCYVRNGPKLVTCPACGGTKPGETVQKSEPKSLFGSGPTGVIGESGGFRFGSGASPSTAAFSFGTQKPTGDSVDGAKPSGGFSFGKKSEQFSFGSASSSSAQKTEAESSTSEPPSSTKATFSFGKQSEPDSTTGFSFGAKEGSTGFSFSMTPTASSSMKPLDLSKTTAKSPGGDEGYYVNDDHDVHFEPIVPLPDKVEVKTGEEDEDILFVQRAKLFRYVDTQWKERGLGDIKILRQKSTNKTRLLMRREQILKICCNHAITEAIELKPMSKADGKAWVWFAMDCSEEEPQQENFAIKFKTTEIAQQFKDIFDKAKSNSSDLKPVENVSKGSVTPKKDSSAKKEEFVFKSDVSTTPADAKPSGFKFTPSPSAQKFTSPKVGDAFSFVSTPPSSKTASEQSPLARREEIKVEAPSFTETQDLVDDDIEIVYEWKPTPEQMKLAEKYMLNPGFYRSLEAPPCPGCRGCDEEDLKERAETTSAAQSLLGQLLSSTTAEVQEQTLTQQVSSTTGNLGNLAYSKELNKLATKDVPVEEEIVSSSTGVLGDRGNLSYSKELNKGASATVSEEIITSTTAGVTGDKGNPEYAKQLDKGAADSTSGNSLFANTSVTGFSFASVAADSSGSGFNKNKDSNKPFSWSGAGKSVFGESKEHVEGDDNEVVPSDDIHFEPIVSLPEVETKTGEEDEEAIYTQRSKIFRFHKDLNQWKERGIGTLKILKHKENGKMRVLLRREQVLKIACNFPITSDIKLQPLQTSETSWCFVCSDFTDNEAKIEQFALKFKTPEVAGVFKEKFEECQSLLDASGSGDAGLNLVTSSQPESETPANKDEKNNDDQNNDENKDDEAAGGYNDEYDDDDDYEDEDEQNILFQKRVTLSVIMGNNQAQTVGLGELLVLYDDEFFGSRVTMQGDDGNVICNHLVATETRIQRNRKKKFCEWEAIDFATNQPIRRTFRAQFSSENAAEEFEKMIIEGKEFATQSGIYERDIGCAMPREIDIPEVAGRIYEQGDEDNGKSLHEVVESVITTGSATVTGSRGNPYYAAQLASPNNASNVSTPGSQYGTPTARSEHGVSVSDADSTFTDSRET